nr:Hsp70 family protein [Actinomycetales bacterium]
MTYLLGVDIGSSRIHAATARTSSSGIPEIESVPLGSAAPHIPALVAVTADGRFEFGEEAASRGATEPQNLVSGVRRRIGDDVPFVVGSQQIPAEDAYARLATAVIETVTTAEGEPPAHVTFTYPAGWGPFRVALVQDALGSRYAGRFHLMPEAEAAARGSRRRVPQGRALAVYDLGGTTFDATVLRRDATDWTVLDETGGSRVGGANFDDAVVDHVLASLASPGGVTGASLVALRRECTGAKEALTSERAVTIPAPGTDGPAMVRLTRTDFEKLIENHLEQTVTTLSETIEGAGLAAKEMDAVLVVGGSSHIPSVQERLSETLECEVVAEDQGALVAMGAARGGWERAESEPPPAEEAVHTARAVHEEVPLPKFVLSATGGSSRVATYIWRVILVLLVLGSAYYLYTALNSENRGLFGAPTSGLETPAASVAPAEPTTPVNANTPAPTTGTDG